jgi:xylulose-5-phosphate/fructose-6-phosphate phosphoketolase
MNQLDRFHLTLAAIRRLPEFSDRSAQLAASIGRKLEEHKAYVREHGEDMPEIQAWRWSEPID